MRGAGFIGQTGPLAPLRPIAGPGGATPRLQGHQLPLPPPPPPLLGLWPTVSWGGSWRPEPRGRPPRVAGRSHTRPSLDRDRLEGAGRRGPGGGGVAGPRVHK